MSTFDINAAANALKQRYLNPRYLAETVYPDNPLFALIAKRTDAGGVNWKFPLRIALTGGTSVAFASAQANVTGSAIEAFQVTRATRYGYGSISGEAIMAGKGGDNSFIDTLKLEMDGALQVCVRGMSMDLYRNGGGTRGQISSGSSVGTATITLSNINDITNFEKNLVLRASSDDGSASSPAGVRTGSVIVTGVDRNAGTITVSGNWNAGIPAVATGDFLSVDGDYSVAAKGFGAWLLTTAPAGNDNFFSVNRSKDSRLWGVKQIGGGGNMEEILIDCAARLVREGGKPTHLFANPADWATLCKALTSKVFYEESTPTDAVKIGFRTLRFDAPTGPVKIIADLNCPQGTSYLLTLASWELASAGPAPHFVDDDGKTLLRDPSTDSASIRTRAFWNLVCSKGAPGWSAAIQW
jgi:hypothetical protein